MKGRSKSFTIILSKEQKTYLGNLLGIGGGATMYTEWQYIFPLTKVSFLTIRQQIFIMLISAIMILAGLLLQTKDKGKS